MSFERGGSSKASIALDCWLSTETSREFKQRRFWATHVKRKWAFFSFNIPWRYIICIAECLYCYKGNLPKYMFNITAQECKKSTSVVVRRSKTLLLKLSNCFITWLLHDRWNYTLVKSLCGTALKSLLWAPPVHQDLSMLHGLPVKCHCQFVNRGWVAQSMVSFNHWLSSIKTNTLSRY